MVEMWPEAVGSVPLLFAIVAFRILYVRMDTNNENVDDNEDVCTWPAINPCYIQICVRFN